MSLYTKERARNEVITGEDGDAGVEDSRVEDSSGDGDAGVKDSDNISNGGNRRFRSSGDLVIQTWLNGVYGTSMWTWHAGFYLLIYLIVTMYFGSLILNNNVLPALAVVLPKVVPEYLLPLLLYNCFNFDPRANWSIQILGCYAVNLHTPEINFRNQYFPKF
ncbi:hypothetical protein L1887_03580 [Cichorium endivia]|nr:hypothetical protein L1887_03580 [Cichorium endivia]